MSVITPVVDTWDGATRRIYLRAGVTNFFPIEDIYHEYRHERANNEAFRQWKPLLRADGNVPKGAGAFTPRYVVLLDGTKIVPFDESTQLNQLGDMITDNPDVDATLYDVSSLTNPKPIFIKPSEAETIQLNSSAIEYSSFSGGVTYDAINGESGVDYPVGTRQHPAVDLGNAVAIANAPGNGFDTIFVIGDAIIDSGGNYDGFRFVGQSKEKTLLYISSASNVLRTEYRTATIDGTLDGRSLIDDCEILDLVFVSGEVKDSILNGKITLAPGRAQLRRTESGIAGQSTPEIDFNGAGASLSMRGHVGGVLLTNKTGPENASIDLDSGQVKIDLATVTNGEIVVRGDGKVVEATTGAWLPSGMYGNLELINETSFGKHLQEVHETVMNGGIPSSGVDCPVWIDG